ncbi:hypothetical protein L1286_20255 [Pseudoalteromonas sp. SMS1]|uniref:hypothetical protein n=1 Tax=Pseudoalteromonas sp. SMS1 TaxID=2908894 RepID=UPI001F486418|nr:hypothetical protein [Pseudoalteromonas sp. SMS1]MCF2859819.1 hypothetical protein [Pseudoalteromonas sp. SMS1]
MQYRTKPTTQGFIDIAVDCPDLKVYANGDWRTRKHQANQANKGQTRRKLHLAKDTGSHDIVSAALSMMNVSDGQVLGELLQPKVP